MHILCREPGCQEVGCHFPRRKGCIACRVRRVGLDQFLEVGECTFFMRRQLVCQTQYRQQQDNPKENPHHAVRLPGAGGSSGGPAKHWAMAIQAVAGSPTTVRLTSWMLRP